MIEIHLYGTLRRHAPDPQPDRESVVRLEPQPGETVGTTLERLSISPAEVYHVFLNGWWCDESDFSIHKTEEIR